MTVRRNEQGQVRPALLDIQQVAELLNISIRTIYRLVEAGKMPKPVKLGNLIRWNSKELDQWLEAGCSAQQITKGAQDDR